MAHSLSAKKRIRQNAKRKVLNRRRLKDVKLQVRKVADAIKSRDTDAATTELRAAIKKIDKVAAKGTFHKNTAARKKSRLQRRLNAVAGK
ncbi:MAG: 30S ribosomal protein S20 [Phycisphaerae bacterium]|nr:30S ribosomal protein S20 [Phycisphaerae bacterium]